MTKWRAFKDTDIRTKTRTDLRNDVIGSMLKFGPAAITMTPATDRLLKQHATRRRKEIAIDEPPN